MTTGTGPGDDVLNEEIEEIIEEMVRLGTAKMHVGCWGVITAYAVSTQTCSVRPVVRGAQKGGASFRWPVITNVPVRFPSGGGFSISWPIVAGDQVWLDFSDRSIDEWANTADPTDVDPRSKRRFHISDAVAYPGGRPGAKPLVLPSSTDLVIGQDGYGGAIDNPDPTTEPLQIRIGPSGIAIGDGTPPGLANADLLNILDRLLDGIIADATTIPTAGAAATAEKVILAKIKR